MHKYQYRYESGGGYSDYDIICYNTFGTAYQDRDRIVFFDDKPQFLFYIPDIFNDRALKKNIAMSILEALGNAWDNAHQLGKDAGRRAIQYEIRKLLGL